MNDKRIPKQYTLAEAKTIGDRLSLDWAVFTVKQFRAGLNAEFADGAYNPMTSLATDDPILIGKIVRAHLNESHDYYTQWAQMEETAARQHSSKPKDTPGP